jgi:hypothetical protein
MTSSEVQDTDSDTYPDVLSVNYVHGTLTTIPTAISMTEAALAKFWLYFYAMYRSVEYDDLFLNINGIPYLGMLEPNSILYKISSSDLTGFITEKQVGYDDED